MTSTSVGAAAALAAALLLGSPLAAADPGALQAAEAAYQSVDFEATRAEAVRALESGNQPESVTSRLYELLGIAHAALGETAKAREAFIRMLAISPERKLHRMLAPKIRAPYLEAKGFWGSRTARLGARVRWDARRREVTVEVTDPVNIVRRGTLRVRTDSGDFRERGLRAKAGAAERLAIRSGSSRAIEYALELHDEHGNVVHAKGTEAAPIRIEGPRIAEPARASHASSSPPNYALAGVLAVAGLAAGGAGVYFHVRREDYAERWNSAACEQPGPTRAEQCSGVNADRLQAERFAIGLYGGAFALLSASVVTLLVSGGTTHGAAPSDVAISCAAGSGLWCSGRF